MALWFVDKHQGVLLYKFNKTCHCKENYAVAGTKPGEQRRRRRFPVR